MSGLAKVEPVVLRGRFVYLEPMADEHAEELFAAGKDERIWTYMSRGPLRSLDDTREFIRAALAGRQSGRDFPFVLRHAASGQLVGSSRYLDIQPIHRSVEIGWTFVHPQWWGTRASGECEFLLIRHAFESLNAVRVWFKTDLRNERAQKTMENYGLVKEGVLRRHMVVRDGFIRDSVVYSIILEEWPAACERAMRIFERRPGSLADHPT